MPTMVNSLRIAAPVQIVWDATTDFKAWEQIADVRVDELTKGPFGVGSRWRETRKMMGRESSQEWEVTFVREPTQYTCVSEAMGARWVFDQFLVPDGKGTRLFSEFEITPDGAMSRAMFAVTWPGMSLMMRRGVADDMAKFAARCEQLARESGAAKS